MHDFHCAWEPEIARTLDDPAFVQPRLKLHLLVDDLARLGAAQIEPGQLPRPSPLRLESTAGALGSMYVLEGSTLGGKLIARQVAAAIGHIPSYHDAYGSRTGSMWHSFQAHLESEVSASQADTAIMAARATFSWLGDCLTRD